MKKLLLFVTKSIVDNPEQVSVDQAEENGSIVLRLSVAEQDMGRIIGKEGKMINAIRSLMRVAARKQGQLVRIELQEPTPKNNNSPKNA